MKKLYTLLAAALALFSLGSPTAMAQVAEITPGYYVIQGHRSKSGKDVLGDINAHWVKATNMTELPSTITAENATYVWKVETAENVGGVQYYTLQNLRTGRYIQGSNENSDFFSVYKEADSWLSRFTFPATSNSGSFNIVDQNNNQAHLASGLNLVRWQDAGGSSNAYEFYSVKVSASVLAACALNSLLDGQELNETNFPTGINPGCITSDTYKLLEEAQSAYNDLDAGTATDEQYNTVITQIETAAAALEADRSVKAGYYVIGGRRTDATFTDLLYDNSGTLSAKHTDVPTTIQLDNAQYVWQLEEHTTGTSKYFTLRNLLTGQYMTGSSNNGKVFTTSATASDNYTRFNFHALTGRNFIMEDETAATAHLNQSLNVQRYPYHDDVCSWFNIYAVTPSESLIALVEAYSNLFGTATLDEYLAKNFGSDPGLISTEAQSTTYDGTIYAQVKAAYDAYQSCTADTYEATAETLNKAAAVVAAATLNSVTPGYYIIRGCHNNTNTGQSIDLLYVNGSILSGETADIPTAITMDNAKYVWQLIESGDGLTMRNLATGQYVQSNTSTSGQFPMTDESAATTFTFPYQKGRLFKMYDQSNNLYGHLDGWYNVVNWNSDTDRNMFEFHAVDAEVEAAITSMLGSHVPAEIMAYNVGTDPGCFSAESEAATTLQTAASGDLGDLFRAGVSVASAERNPMRPGFYVIRGYRRDNNYGPLYYTGSNVAAGNLEEMPSPLPENCDLTYVWQIDETDDMLGYRIRSCASNVYLALGTQAKDYGKNIPTGAEAGDFVIPHESGRMFRIKSNTGGAHLNSAGTLIYWTNDELYSMFEFYEVPAFAISSSGYATLYVDHAFVMPEGVDGGYITGVGEKTPADGDTPASATLTYNWMDYAEGNVVPALTPLVLRAKTVPTTTTTYLYNKSTEAGTAPTDENNYLRGALTTGEQTEGGTYYYKLCYGGANDDLLGFWWGVVGGGAFPNFANKAYLALPATLAGADLAGFALEPGSDITAITSPTLSTSEQPAAIYTLSGVRVNSSTTDGLPAGIYIVGGKKVLVK